MKCINKIAALFLILILTGCSGSEIEGEYDLSGISGNQTLSDTTTENFASSFASDLCIANEDLFDLISADMDNATVAGVFDVSDCETLYSKNIHMQMNPASLTKIVTALVALKYGNMEDTITVDEDIVFNESGVQVCGLEKGDTLTLDQLMHLMLINSANDAAVVIARSLGGSIDGFAEMMNETVASIGATNSNFKNPHGLTEDGHYTTAYDLYLIFNECIKYELFNEIIHMDSYSTVLTDSNGDSKTIEVSTTNQYLKGNYTAPENITVLGGKTGTTNAAGNCLILHVKDTQGKSYIAVILQSSERAILYQEMTDLLEDI